ncbi:MAG: LysR substrate-binding domain-containing protein, partial [Pseudomonadota bacterium]
FLSRPGHEVVALLQAEDADLGLASPMEPPEGLRARALLHDPYLVVVPAARSEGAEAYLRGEAALPFLRYSLKQLIGRRIEAQLRRLRAELPRRFEFESTRTILSLVAQGRAWTITTALNLAATPEVSAGLRALPLPDAAFSRRIALLQREDLHPRLLDEVEALLRPLLEAEVVAPMLAREPGLEGVFRLLEDQ